MKIRIIYRKATSQKSGNQFLSGAIKIGDFGTFDNFFPSATNVLAITGMSMEELQNAPVGLLCEKVVEVE